MRRWCLIVASAMGATVCADCHAQWYGGWGGYTEPATPYSSAVRAQAEMAMAQGAAAENYARAAIANEQARSVYLENEARMLELRRQRREATHARNEQRKQEQKERAARRPPPKRRTERYPRLSSDQIDPLTGEVHWPECLMGDDYGKDRKSVEDALQTQAEFGAGERTTKIIYDASHRMMLILAPSNSRLGSEAYQTCRKFLTSLSVEGDHAQEALK